MIAKGEGTSKTLIDYVPCAFGGSALGCTGDLVSPFLMVSLGELPMVEFNSGRRGNGRERVAV